MSLPRRRKPTCNFTKTETFLSKIIGLWLCWQFFNNWSESVWDFLCSTPHFFSRLPPDITHFLLSLQSWLVFAKYLITDIESSISSRWFVIVTWWPNYETLFYVSNDKVGQKKYCQFQTRAKNLSPPSGKKVNHYFRLKGRGNFATCIKVRFDFSEVGKITGL